MVSQGHVEFNSWCTVRVSVSYLALVDGHFSDWAPVATQKGYAMDMAKLKLPPLRLKIGEINGKILKTCMHWFRQNLKQVLYSKNFC